MARPISRRRGGNDEPAPDADNYTRGRGRSAAADEPEDERRPRRGRGELPGRQEPEDERPSRRSRRSEPEDEPQGDDYPESKKELGSLNDKEFDELVDHFKIGDDVADDDLEDAVWEAIQATREPTPSRRSRRGASEPADEPEEPRRGRRGRTEEPEDDAPRGRRGGRGGKEQEEERPRRTAAKGFKGFQKTKEQTSSFADDFKLSDEEVLVKFIDDEPFATYGEHGLYKELNDGQRVWVCLAPEEPCAICDTGHNARAVALWNVVVIPEEGKPELKILKAGPLLEKLIEKKAALKSGPMSREYYSLSQTPGKNDGPPIYAVEVIRERELEDEWKFKPFTDSELDDWESKAYDETFVKYPSISQVREVARKLRDSD